MNKLVSIVLLVLAASFIVAHTARRSQRLPAHTMAAADAVSLVFVTVPSKEVGKKIAHNLVESKLAACVNIIPGLESVYFWEGKVQLDEELLLKIKTRKELVPQLTAAVKAQHPYTECEVTAVDVAGGSESYLQWVLDSTKPQ